MARESSGVSRKVVIALNTTWNLVTFRANLIRALVAHGYEVVAVAPEDSYVGALAELNCRYISIPMDNRGTRPYHDLTLLWRYWRTFRRERPAALLGFTIKPNVYGSLAAHLLGIPVINNIAGLGTAYLKPGWLNLIANMLYRVSLSRSRRVFFQNLDDLNLFLKSGLVRPDQARRIPGSGVDVSHFVPRPASASRRRPFRFLLLGRLMWDKGVGEYVAAAKRLRDDGVCCNAQLLGFVDVKNPSAISRGQVETWVEQNLVEYLGEARDVRPFLADADCIVLPSYREGLPRALLEGASMGKPIIATDTPGCRDVVENGVTGYLVPERNVVALADAMRLMITTPPIELRKMGVRARKKIVEEFDEQIVISAYLEILASSIQRAPT
jgi:glycosyltransferase involved in cell wall biosynthesis